MLQGNVLSLQWTDKRMITMLTNIHDDQMIEKRRRSRFSKDGSETVRKPLAVDKYNTYMGGTDKSDQLLSYYVFQNKTTKWSKRVAFHLTLSHIIEFLI